MRTIFQMRPFAAGMPDVGEAGTEFAGLRFAMMWAELITIYLAIGAPVGVSRALSGRRRPLTRMVGAALWATLSWPLTAARWLHGKRAAASVSAQTRDGSFGPDEPAQRAALAALTNLSLALRPLTSTAISEQLWLQCRDALEKYAGLTSAVKKIDPAAMPAPRDMEFFRLAGHMGDDLTRAGRCLQRRNAARLRAHQIKARQEFLAALQSAQREIESARAVLPHEETSASYLEELWHEFLERARQLCLALDEADTAQEVTRRLAEEQTRPVLPAVAFENNTPPQTEARKRPPEPSLPLTHLPDIASPLGSTGS
jgi:hypothetical protein